MADGGSGIPRGKGAESYPFPGAFNRVGGRPGVAAAAGCLCRWFLEKWVARGHAGRVGEAVAIWKPHQEPGHTLPPPSGEGGEPAHSVADSVSNWFCPRHFCSRKITIFESNTQL